MYWEQYFSSQQKLKSKDRVLYDILMGRLKPEQENLLYKDGDKLYLNALVRNNSVQYSKEISIPNSANDVYKLSVEYTPSTFNNEDTYKIYRKVYLHYPRFTSDDYLQWISDFSKLSLTENAEETLANSKLYTFLCSNFTCNWERKNNKAVLGLKLTEKLKDRYPYFYKDLKNRIEKTTFSFSLLNGKDLYLKLYNSKDTIFIQFVPFQSNLLEQASLWMSGSLQIQSLGLTVTIKNLNYLLEFKRLPDEITMTGKFPVFPDYKVSGRLFYILPTSAIDFFIPKDIDYYFKSFFEMMVENPKSSGSKFKSVMKKDKENVEVFFESYSQSFQKPFKLIQSEAKEDSNPNFVQDFQQKIIEDLKK